MKFVRGFNLIELMVAIAMSTVLTSLIVSSFSSLNAHFLFNNNQLRLQQNIRFAMTTIKRDLQNAGVFGSFSFHNQQSSTDSIYSNLSTSWSCNNNTDDWCRFDDSLATGMGVGVRSYSNNTDLTTIVPGNGYTLVTGTDILRIQFGGAVSFLNNAPLLGSSNACITRLSFATNGVVPSNIYMLASSNHVYLLNFSSITAPNSILNGVSGATCNYSSGDIQIESYDMVSKISNDPDQSTLQLVNFYTKYYYIATNNSDSAPRIKRLYVRYLSESGTLSDPTVVANAVQNLQLSYTVDITNVDSPRINKFPASNNRYRWCNTGSMGTGLCNWNRINAVNISLTGQSENQSGILAVGSGIIQTESDTVGWLW